MPRLKQMPKIVKIDFKEAILEHLLKNQDEYITKAKIYLHVREYKQGNFRCITLAIDYLYEIGAISTANFRWVGDTERRSTFDCRITPYGIKYLAELKAKKLAPQEQKESSIKTYHVPPELLKTALEQGLSVDSLIKSYN